MSSALNTFNGLQACRIHRKSLVWRKYRSALRLNCQRHVRLRSTNICNGQTNVAETIYPSLCFRLIFVVISLIPSFLQPQLGWAKNSESTRKRPFLIVEGTFDGQSNPDLYIFDMRGQQLQRLTPDVLPSCSVRAISPDGENVACDANASVLYNIALRDHKAQVIHRGMTWEAVFSPDNHALALTEGWPMKSLIIKPIVECCGYSAFEISLSSPISELQFSPDSREVVYVRATLGGKVLVALDASTGANTLIAGDQGISYEGIVFSADGKSLYCLRLVNSDDHYELVAIDWHGRQLRTIRKFGPGLIVQSPAVSSNGKWIFVEIEGVLARMSTSGEYLQGITGALPDWSPIFRLRLVQRGVSVGTGYRGGRYFPWRGASCDMLIDVETGKKLSVGISEAGSPFNVFVIE